MKPLEWMRKSWVMAKADRKAKNQAKKHIHTFCRKRDFTGGVELIMSVSINTNNIYCAHTHTDSQRQKEREGGGRVRGRGREGREREIHFRSENKAFDFINYFCSFIPSHWIFPFVLFGKKKKMLIKFTSVCVQIYKDLLFYIEISLFSLSLSLYLSI